MPPDSTTETYVAMKLAIDNWRWAGVPFYLRTGKALARRRTEITIQFKQAPLALFRDTPVERLPPNDLTLHIQPDEGVTLRFGVKIPGPDGADRRRRHEVPLRGRFPVHAQHRLRDADLRLHDRRSPRCSSAPTRSRPAGG